MHSCTHTILLHTIHFNRLTSSFRIMGWSHNWLKSYLSNRSFSVTSGSFSSFILPSSCGVSCGVPQGSVLDFVLYTIYDSSIASIVSSHGVINSNMLTIHSFFSSFPLHRYLAVSAAFSYVCLFFIAGFFTMVWFKIHLKLRQFALAPVPALIAFQSNFHQACGFICSTSIYFLSFLTAISILILSSLIEW